MSARVIGLFFVAVAACKPAAQDEHEAGEHAAEHGDEHEHVDEPEHGELPKNVHLSPELAEAAGVIATPVRREVLVRTFEVVGQLEADPDRVSRISSRVAGTLASIDFREGDTVVAGQRLASIRAPDLGELRGHKTSLVARLAAAKAQVERLATLEAKRLAAQQDVVAAKADVAALEADLAGITYQLRALGDGRRAGAAGELAVLAPRKGVVIARQAVVGDPVAADTVLGTVADLDEVLFAARVFERDLAKVRVGASAEVTLGAYPGDPFVGTVERIGHVVDATTRTIVARIRLRNREERLRAGLFGTADVALDESAGPDPVLVVARSAVTQIAGDNVVFVQEPDGHYEVHPVVLGASSPGKLEVVHGLREGELVVTEGVFTLKSALLRGTFAEDHH